MPGSSPEKDPGQHWLAAGVAIVIAGGIATVLRLRNGNQQPPIQNGGWRELDLEETLPEPDIDT